MASTEVPYRHEMSGHCGSGALRDLIPVRKILTKSALQFRLLAIPA